MSIRPIFILYGTNSNKDKYYIANLNPTIWAKEFEKAKVFFTQYNAEYEILRDYANYKEISKLIDSGSLDHLYVARIVENKEEWRAKLL